MKGKPKFKLGDKVRFGPEGKRYVGYVYVVDKNGTFFNPNDVCYDILARDENGGEEILFKHIEEAMVSAFSD